MTARAVSADDVGRLDVALRSIAPRDVRVGARRISGSDVAGLRPAEALVVAKAVERRRHEFATGRALLRSLLEFDGPIPVGDNRAPVLPHGVAGSLAHDAEFAVAAVSVLPAVRGIGIDVEPGEPLSDEMARLILRDDERGLDAHLAFTLKEAAYKAWSSLGGRMLEHHEVRLRIDGRTFSAEVLPADRLAAAALPDDRVFCGRYCDAADRWLALVVV